MPPQGSIGRGLLIVDDPHSISQVASDEVRRKDLEIFDTGLSNRVSAGTAILVVMQRLHAGDLSAHLLERGGYDHLLLRNEYEVGRSKTTSIGWKDPRCTDGELLWEAGCDAKQTFEKKKSHGSIAYAGQYQQSPVSKSGGLINPSWFKQWTPATLPQHFDEYLISVDCAFKGTAKSDYVVFQTWARVKQEYYLRDYVRKQMDFIQTTEQFIAFCTKWPQATTKLIEAKANGDALISQLRQKIVGLIPIRVRDSKESRVSAVSPIIESGNIFIT